MAIETTVASPTSHNDLPWLPSLRVSSNLLTSIAISGNLPKNPLMERVINTYSPDWTAPVMPFEHYMLADSRPHIEMGDCYRFTFSGKISRPEFEKSISLAMARHPLLRSLIKGQAGGTTRNLHWHASTLEPYVSWGNAGDAIEVPPHRARMIDPCTELPIRIFVREGVAPAEPTTLIIQLHHAAADAAGLFQFVQDLLTYYEDLSGHPRTLRPSTQRQELKLSHLSRRSNLQRLVPPGIMARVLLLWRTVKFFSLVPEALKTLPPDGCEEVEESWPPALSIQIPEHDWIQKHTWAKKQGTTLNDYLLFCLFRTLDRWNASFPGQTRRKLRLAMALNMRQPEDKTVPAANLVSMCYLDATPSLLDRPEKLLTKIGRETKSIKKHGLGYAMVLIMKAAGRIPGLIQRIVTPRWPFYCLATSALSNLGCPFRGSGLPRRDGKVSVNGLTLDKVEAMPTGRPYLPAAFTANTYGGALTLTISYDPKRFAKTRAQQLLEHFAAAVKDFGNDSAVTDN